MSRENKYRVTKVSKIGSTKMYPKEFDVMNYTSSKDADDYHGDMFQKILDNKMEMVDATTFSEKARAVLREKELISMLEEEMKNMGVKGRKL